jgi:hypothetical protein
MTRLLVNVPTTNKTYYVFKKFHREPMKEPRGAHSPLRDMLRRLNLIGEMCFCYLPENRGQYFFLSTDARNFTGMSTTNFIRKIHKYTCLQCLNLTDVNPCLDDAVIKTFHPSKVPYINARRVFEF